MGNPGDSAHRPGQHQCADAVSSAETRPTDRPGDTQPTDQCRGRDRSLETPGDDDTSADRSVDTSVEPSPHA